MLLIFTVDRIRVRILLEPTFNLVLLEMLLRLYGDRLTVSCWFLCASALRIVLSKQVTEFIDVCLRIWSIIGIHAHLIILVKVTFVAHVQLIGNVKFKTR